MLKPEDIEAIANDITDIYKGVESECVKSIAQHIASGKRVTQASVWQMHKLNEVGLLRKNLLVKVKQNAKNVTLPQVEQLVNEALKRSMLNDVNAIGRGLSKYATVSEALEQLQNSQQFQHIVKSAIAGCKDVINLTGTKAVQASVKAYTDAINTAYLEMATGNYTFEDAVKRAVGRIGESGIKIVDSKDKATGNEIVKLAGTHYTTYKSANGTRIYPLDSAIRRDLTTAINRSCGQLTLDTCGDLGSELVETTWHVGARPEHEVWQGRIFSLNPKDTRYPYFYASQEQGGTGYGDMLGLCGINCYHSFNPYFEGSEQSTHDNKPTAEENAQAYKEQQTQRAYERNLRSLKREQMAYQEAGFVDKAQDAQRRVNDMSARYKKFLNETGRTRVSMLDKVSGYKRISLKDNAVIPQPTTLAKPVVRHRTSTAKHVAPPPTPQERFDKAKRFDYTDPINRTGGESWRISQEAHDYHSTNNFDENKWSSLSSEERRAVRDYTGSSYQDMNRALWKSDPKMNGEYIEQKINNCMSAINHFEVKEDVICYRGACSYEQFAKQFGLVADDLRSEAVRNSLTGQLWQEKGFTSLASSRESAWSKNIKLEVCVPKGTKGLYVSARGKAVSAFGEGERELLINPSSMQILGNYYDRMGQLWFKVCIVKQP